MVVVPYQPLRGKIQEAVNAGLVPVAAAGNGGGKVDYPGAWDDLCITATAIDKNFNPANFTDRGKEADVAAAGVRVVSVAPNNTYPRVNGTSFAAPIVAGVIAHIAEQHFEDLKNRGKNTLKLVEGHLKKFAKDFGKPGEDELGAGYTIIKPYLENPVIERDEEEEEPDYPDKKERVITLQFNDYSTVWGSRMRKLTPTLIDLDKEGLSSQTQTMYINRLVVNVVSDKFAEEHYKILKDKFDKFFTRRGFLLPENNDINDAMFWVEHFMKLLIKDEDFDVVLAELSDDSGTKLIYNDINT